MTNELLSGAGEPAALVTPPNVSQYLESQLADGKTKATLIKDVEAQIEKAALDAFGKEYIFKAVVGDDGSVRILQILDIVETVTNEYRQVSLENARKVAPETKLGAQLANVLEYDELATPFGVLTPVKMKTRNMSLVKAVA